MKSEFNERYRILTEDIIEEIVSKAKINKINVLAMGDIFFITDAINDVAAASGDYIPIRYITHIDILNKRIITTAHEYSFIETLSVGLRNYNYSYTEMYNVSLSTLFGLYNFLNESGFNNFNNCDVINYKDIVETDIHRQYTI